MRENDEEMEKGIEGCVCVCVNGKPIFDLRKMTSTDNINMFSQMLFLHNFSLVHFFTGCSALHRLTSILQHEQYWHHSFEIWYIVYHFSYSAPIHCCCGFFLLIRFTYFCIECAYSSKMPEYLNEWKIDEHIHLHFFLLD